jgi:GNAT superfamily N-acetyltransferase
MDGWVIRRAVTSDLAQAYDLWYDIEVDGDATPPPRGGIPTVYEHELETGEMYVAEVHGQVVGFGAVIRRGSVSFVSELFVRRAQQSFGLGKALLSHITPKGARICCTLSSRDPRALALYIRGGMHPLWQNYLLIGKSSDLKQLPNDDVQSHEQHSLDPKLVRWDAEVSGRLRTIDHEYWLRKTQAVPLWFCRKKRRIGYGYVQMQNNDFVYYPEAVTIGPIGASLPDEAVSCVCEAVRWAKPRSSVVRIGVPAAHPSLPVLLNCGFQITYVETFLSTSTKMFANMQCYVPSDSTLF